MTMLYPSWRTLKMRSHVWKRRNSAKRKNRQSRRDWMRRGSEYRCWASCCAVVYLSEYYALSSQLLLRLAFKAFIHGTLLNTATVFLPLLLFSFGVNFLLHLTYPAPSAGEDTRGYLHGGLMIDFIGQQGPTSKWKLGALDVCILFLQLVMVSVHVKRRELKKKLAKLSAGATTSNATATDRATSDPPPPATTAANSDNAVRGQDVDDEERGVLHRTDTMSDIGLDPDSEQDALLPTSESGHGDAMEVLSSGQCVIGDFTLFDTLLQENRNYSAYRLTRTESGMNDMPETLRRLNTLRTRFGVGGG
ncbi:hypothetical protein P3342_011256 [Pyrenophora teres f. teres]|nr:hypothetical protein P3342_011256 [Pyrenophora teres f. teres]